MYNKVVESVQETSNHIRTDDLQQIHTYYNYAKVVSLWFELGDENIMKQRLHVENIQDFINQLERKCAKLCDEYSPTIKLQLKSLSERQCEVSERISRKLAELSSGSDQLFAPTKMWWSNLFQHLPEDLKTSLFCKIMDSVIGAPGICSRHIER